MHRQKLRFKHDTQTRVMLWLVLQHAFLKRA